MGCWGGWDPLSDCPVEDAKSAMIVRAECAVGPSSEIGMTLSYVIKDCVPNLDAIVVCVYLWGVIVLVEIQIIFM